METNSNNTTNSINEKETISILNDLIRINNDRVEGYTKAINQLKEATVRELFQEFVDESNDFAEELKDIIQSELGGEPAENTTASGKIYRAWMDIKATFNGHDTASIIAACEFGEDAAQKAYKTALDANDIIVSEIFTVVKDQQESLKEAHDQVRILKGVFGPVKES